MFSKHPDVVYDQLNEAHRFGEQTSFTFSFSQNAACSLFHQMTLTKLDREMLPWIKKQTFSPFGRTSFLAINNLVIRPIEASCGAVLPCYRKLQ